MKRRRDARRSGGPSGRGGRGRRRELEPTGADDLAGTGWVDCGGELVWAVGFTAGGAPYGLRASEFDLATLAALGLADAASSSTRSCIDEANDPESGAEGVEVR